jgi:type I restriction enzyme S subunit
MTESKIYNLNEVCQVYQPETISRKALPENGIYPVYGANGKIGLNDKYNHEEPQLLLGCRGSVGSIHISEPFSWINGNAMVVKPVEALVSRDYLRYALLGGINIIDAISGTAQPQITRESLSRIKIPVPTLEKQREIVEKLDSAFGEIEVLQTNLQLSDKKADRLLQSLLSSAFSSAEDENGSNDRSDNQLTDRKLVPLGEVAEVIAGQSPEGIYYNSNGDGAPFYQGKKEFGAKFLGAPTTWTTKVTKLAQAGDILMSVRAPVGPINFSTQEICIGRGLASIRASKSVVKEFLYYFLLHKQSEISGNTGAVFDSINKEQIASIKIPVPSLEKQREIVEMLDSAFNEVELLKAQMRTKKDYASALRQSLLSNAFTQEEAIAQWH